MNRLTLNTALQIAMRCLELLSGLLVNAWLARQWGSGAFGQVAFFMSLSVIVTFLFDFGLPNLLMRTVSRVPRQATHLVLNAVLLLIPQSILGAIAIFGLGLWQTQGAYLAILAWICLQLALNAALQLMRSSFYAFERMELECLPTIVERGTWIVAALYLAAQPPSLPALFAWLAISKGAGLLTTLFLYIRFIKPHTDPGKPERPTQLTLAKQALPFGLNIGFCNIFHMSDVLFLARWASDAAVGHYRAVGLLIYPFTLVAEALINSLFPRMCAASKSGPEAVRAYGAIAASILMRVAIPASLFIMLYSREIVTLVYGEDYLPAAPLLAMLALCIPIRFLTNALGTVLSANDQQGKRMLCAAIAAGFNLGLNAFVIPRWHALGACVTALLTDLVFGLSLWFFLRPTKLQQPTSFVVALQSLALSGILILPLFWLKLPLLAAAPLFALAYAALLLLGRFRFLSPAERQLLLSNAVP